MRILVISDSHGDSYSVREAIIQQPTAKEIVFLGDGEYDIDSIGSLVGNIPVIKVRGNCDLGSSLPAYAVDEIEGVRIYCTHGYAENVKYTMSILKEKAVENKATVVLYGHTHKPDTTYEDGIWYVNPGSVRQGTYAVIDVTPKGIMPIIMKLR